MADHVRYLALVGYNKDMDYAYFTNEHLDLKYSLRYQEWEDLGSPRTLKLTLTNGDS